jgi:2-desacetyl-2-hydroxyethyl bacteriochlorophyllide A dehydrogenase
VKAFVMTGIGQGGLETVPDPQPRTEDIVIAPVYSGLCGTDVHMFREGTLTRPDVMPVIMGHEFVGEVVDVNGHNTTLGGRTLSRGTLVAVEPLLPCGKCRMCLRGRPNLCSDWDHLGILRDGCWADFVTAPATRISVVPDGVSARDAALSEPLACAVNFVVHQGKMAAGESVLILGGGPIGLLCAAMAKVAGAGLVAISEPIEHRRVLAKEIGADVVYNPLVEDVHEAVMESTHGRGYDLIIEATGVSAVVGQAIHLAQPGSRLVLAGLGGSSHVGVDANAIVTKELEVRGGFASRWAMDTGLSALASGNVRTDKLISSIRSFSDAEEAMDDMLSDPTTCKILFGNPFN